MRRLSAMALALLLASTASAAQSPGVPVMGSSAEEPMIAESEKQLTQILVLGDAIGGGMGAGLQRVADAGVDYQVSMRFNEESGLARPEVYDWAATLPKILASNPYDVIVVMIGANDRQPIRAGDTRHAFGSEGWVEAYEANVDALLDVLAASGAKVIWVSQPPMKDADYDDALKAVSALQRNRVEAHGMTFLDIRGDLLNPDGSFAETGLDEAGNTVRLRSRDGITFFKAGNNLVGRTILAAIEGDQRTALELSPGPGKSGKEQQAVQAGPQVPLFGQALADGGSYTVSPEGVTANAILLAAGGLDPQSALKTLRNIAPQGSNAERLFKRGEVAQAPRGRTDDFSAPPPASP
jgi:uncharacterized protein